MSEAYWLNRSVYVFMKYFGRGGLVEFYIRASGQDWVDYKAAGATYYLGSGAR